VTTVRVGAIQICSVQDPSTNLLKIRKYLDQARELKVQAVFLPEVFYSISENSNITPFVIDGFDHHYQAIKQLAQEYNIFLLGGSATTKMDNKIVNRSYNFDPLGNDLGWYDKIHIFACDIERDGKQVRLDEGKIYSAGDKLQVVEAGNLRIGLSICFDIRFPEMYLDYTKQNINLISISSAFTVPSGKAHWHTLVRARAIETQSFVVAADQWGKHNQHIETFGHSLIVDPWGDVLADAGIGEKLIYADLDLERIQTVRKSIILRR
jgi:predicted amidohydrolase